MTTYQATHPGYQELQAQTNFGRLHLIQPALAHAPASLAWVSDPEVTRLMGADYPDVSLAGEEERLRQILKDADAYHWIVIFEDRAVGNINLNEITATSQVLRTKAGGLAILLGDKNVWGRGIATAATQAVIAWAFQQGGFSAIVARAVTQNLGSIRLLEKVGFVPTGTETYDGPDFGEPTQWHNYLLTRSAWQIADVGSDY